MPYNCKWCKMVHNTIHECSMANAIVSENVKFSYSEFATRMQMLLNPSEADLTFKTLMELSDA